MVGWKLAQPSEVTLACAAEELALFAVVRQRGCFSTYTVPTVRHGQPRRPASLQPRLRNCVVLRTPAPLITPLKTEAGLYAPTLTAGGSLGVVRSVITAPFRRALRIGKNGGVQSGRALPRIGLGEDDGNAERRLGSSEANVIPDLC